MTKGQTALDFPVRKATRSRGKITAAEESPVPQSKSRKRVTKKENGTIVPTENGCSPPKVKRYVKKAVNSPRPPLSPIRNIPSLSRNILNSPPKRHMLFAAAARRSILGQVEKKSPLKSTDSPVKDSSSTLSGLNLSPKISRALTFSPTKAERSCPTPVLKKQEATISKGARSLNFSPVKDAYRSPTKCYSPVKHPLTPTKTPRSLLSPLRLAKQEGICYQRAKQALHTALPERLVGREKEKAVVDKFLEKHLGKDKPGSLYISGAPGTGKTAMLSHVMQDLEERSSQVVYINCMSMKNSQAIYNKVLSELKGKDISVSTKEAVTQCEKCLTSRGDMAVMILDEVDQLDSKNQEILYTMFEWPSLPKSRLVMIGIANALDLTDRILPRLQGRKCKPTLLNFTPYTKDQIVSIVKDRLAKVEVDGHAVIEPSAIQFCARKVAAVAGDMRKALDICRRAIEVVESDVRAQQVLVSPSKYRPAVPKKISVATISRIVSEVYGSRVVSSTSQQQTFPLQQKLALCTMLLLVKHGKGRKEVTLGKLHDTYCKICQKQQVTSVDQSEFMSMCGLIEARGILSQKRTKAARMTKILLKLDEEELESALQDKILMAAILQNGLPK